MKRTISGLLVAACAFLLIAGCEKEQLQPASTSWNGSEKLLHHDNQPAKIPNIILAASVSAFCGSKIPCGAIMYSTVKNNMLSITNNSQTWFPSLTYTYYKHISTSGTIETYQPITGAQYTCSLATSPFASGALDNNMKVLVFANDPVAPGPSMSTNLQYDTSTGFIVNYPSVAAPSAYIRTTMGAFEGQSCIIDK